MANAVFWFRRDLRLEDNAGLYYALRSGLSVYPVFIFDTHILNALSNRKDARVHFIHHILESLNHQLQLLGSSLYVFHGKPEELWPQIIDLLKPEEVFTNRDYESYALERDKKVEIILGQKGIKWNAFKDHVIFEKNEVLKNDGKPYTVFTPFQRKWIEKLNLKSHGPNSFYLQSYPVIKYIHRLAQVKPQPIPALEEIGFASSDIPFPSIEVAQGVIKNYDKVRNFPGVAGTSRLGIHFRFGTISIREKARKAFILNKTYLNELIWRDFYSMILQSFPHVEKNSFRPEYDRIEWRNDPEDFSRWCEGKTGYPMVDAGMRELNSTGFMHNRVRMVTASFLTKHLLIDWRWGEAYFAEKLLDFDLASNNGGWQWAAGCGTDAAPYFRIFNPQTQMEKFDPKGIYIKKYVPEWGTGTYPKPIIEHKFARERCLEAYKMALNKG